MTVSGRSGRNGHLAPRHVAMGHRLAKDPSWCKNNLEELHAGVIKAKVKTAIQDPVVSQYDFFQSNLSNYMLGATELFITAMGSYMSLKSA